MAKVSGVRKKLSQISHAKHQERLAARRLYEAQKKTKQLQREQQAISLVRAAINSTAEAKIKALQNKVTALEHEKAQLIKDRHEVTAYHVSQEEKLRKTIKLRDAENAKLKERIEKLRAENAKLWKENDVMAEEGLKRMAKFKP